MAASKETAVEAPTPLVGDAGASAGEDVTATALRGMGLIAARRAQRRLMELGGTHSIAYDLGTLREDR